MNDSTLTNLKLKRYLLNNNEIWASGNFRFKAKEYLKQTDIQDGDIVVLPINKGLKTNNSPGVFQNIVGNVIDGKPIFELDDNVHIIYPIKDQVFKGEEQIAFVYE